MPPEAADAPHPLLRELDELIAAERLEDALELAEEIAEDPPDDLPDDDLGQIEHERLALRFELGDAAGLLEVLEQYDPSDPAAAMFEVRAHLLRWDVERAKARMKELRPMTEGEALLDADRLELEAVVDDLEGRFDEADRKLRRANRKAPDDHPLPVRLDPDQASALLERTLAALPDAVRAGMKNLIVEIVPMPRIEPPSENGVTSPWILGLYTGHNALERDVSAPDALPPRVQIYQRNLERTCSDLASMEEELRVTLLHEVGHHLGFDEDGVAALGLE